MLRNRPVALVAGFAAWLVAAVVAAAPSAEAHFRQGAQLRSIVVAPGEDGGALTVHVRTPLPLLFSDVVRDAQARAAPLDTPFLVFERTGAGARYRLSMAAVDADPERFRARLEHALTVSQNGHALPARLIGHRILARGDGTPFDSAAAARAALAGEDTGLDPVFGEAVVVLALAVAAPVPAGPLEIATALPALPLPDGVSIDNHLVDARGGEAVAFTREGQLVEPVRVDGSALRAILAFVWQGVLHIVEGIDHVLFVVCLAIGAASLRRLLLLVTGFTIGHSVTLIGSFLGLAPTWPWFVPAVEAAIAASIVYAAVVALRGIQGSILVTTAIGLLHGFGFSFVLADLLSRDAGALLAPLLAFNVGVELGQVAIVLATLAVIATLKRVDLRLMRPVRIATTGLIAAVALYWLVERVALVV